MNHVHKNHIEIEVHSPFIRIWDELASKFKIIEVIV